MSAAAQAGLFRPCRRRDTLGITLSVQSARELQQDSEATMKTISRKRAPKVLPPAVSNLVAEGGNVLASDEATVVTVAPAVEVKECTTPSAKPRTSRAKQRGVATI
jgi:hypothetical protein